MKIVNIYLSRYKKLAIFWTITILAVLIITLSLYTVVNNNHVKIEEIFNQYPKETLEAFGINVDTIFTPLGYYCYIFKFITLVSAFFAAHLGLTVILDDKKNLTSVFLLTKPLNRKEIYNKKKNAALLLILISNIIYFVVSLIMILIIKGSQSFDFLNLVYINFSVLLLQLTFFYISMMVSSFINKPKNLIRYSVIIILAFFCLSIIEGAYPNIVLRYINPFSYFSVDDILKTHSYQYRFLIASVFIVFFSNTFARVNYEQEDFSK